jgi:hypothetical protein
MTSAAGRTRIPLRRGLTIPLLVLGGLLTGALLSELGVRLFAALNPRLGARILAYDPMNLILDEIGFVL